MPQLCRFYGIVSYSIFQDHNPPHFHAHYGEYQCEIGIHDLQILDGSLPRRAYSLVLEWAALHRAELLQCWELASGGKPFKSIEPLH